MELSDLKKQYIEFQKKYGLPEFSKLNEDFEIEKIDRESDIFLKTIRKVMMEKMVNSLAFLDMMMNPMNAPRIYLPYISSMGVEDKKIIDNLYGAFGEVSLACLPLEMNYSEKEEAEMIKHIYEQWDKSRKGFSELLKKVHKPVKNDIKKEKSYFG